MSLHIEAYKVFSLFFSPEAKKQWLFFFSYLLYHPPTCIPVVPTASPRQLSGEAVEEVEDGPGKDHYIVHI